MTGDYAAMLEQVTSALSMSGFKLAEDEEYRAVVERADGWRLVLDGEKLSYPAFGLFLFPPDLARSDNGLMVDILMEIFPSQVPEDEVPPTLENQLKFLVRFGHTLFSMPVSDYLVAYDEINEGFEMQ